MHMCTFLKFPIPSTTGQEDFPKIKSYHQKFDMPKSAEAKHLFHWRFSKHLHVLILYP